MAASLSRSRHSCGGRTCPGRPGTHYNWACCQPQTCRSSCLSSRPHRLWDGSSGLTGYWCRTQSCLCECIPLRSYKHVFGHWCLWTSRKCGYQTSFCKSAEGYRCISERCTFSSCLIDLTQWLSPLCHSSPSLLGCRFHSLCSRQAWWSRCSWLWVAASRSLSYLSVAPQSLYPVWLELHLVTRHHMLITDVDASFSTSELCAVWFLLLIFHTKL